MPEKHFGHSKTKITSSFIQTLLLVSELHRILQKKLADFTASREFHPAPKTLFSFKYCITLYCKCQEPSLIISSIGFLADNLSSSESSITSPPSPAKALYTSPKVVSFISGQIRFLESG